jgi:hypothetical protein
MAIFRIGDDHPTRTSENQHIGDISKHTKILFTQKKLISIKNVHCWAIHWNPLFVPIKNQ